MTVTELPMNLGPQPMEDLLARLTLSNHDVVDAAEDPAVTHKVINKARKGRQLTARMQKKVLRAVNLLLTGKGRPAVQFGDLFSYVGR